MEKDRKWWLFKQNKGVSLLELIVVIGIIAVLTGVAVLSFNVIPKSRVRSCLRIIVSTIEGTRMDALSFCDAEVKIYCNSEGVYADSIVYKDAGTASIATEKIGGADMEVYFLTNESGATEVLLEEGDGIIFSFDRSSGGFECLEGMLGGSSVVGNVYCKEIKVVSGDITGEIELVPLTGKVYIK